MLHNLQLINGETTTDKMKITNGFNKYFVNIGQTLARDITQDNKSSMTYMENRVFENMVITPVIEEEVQSIGKKKSLCCLGSLHG